jgi:hypothetical protein
MEENRKGILLILLKAKEDFSYGFPILDEVKIANKNIVCYDVDNYSESLVLQMAEKFLGTLNESVIVIVEKDEFLEINGVARLLANLAKNSKKPTKTIFLGKNESVLRFSHWLSIQQVSNENELKVELSTWVTEQ